VPRLPGAALGGGVAMMYLSLVVLVPLAAVVARSFEGGLDSFWNAVTNEQALAALKLTVGV
jgi:sulfate/thiosulfate transport system permease protein